MASSPRGLGQAMAALQFADYRRFAASLLLTSIGLQLIQVAVFWQVYELTGSALLLGLTGLARAAPHMILSLMGGVVADRFNRVRLIQSGQVANGLLIVVLGALAIDHSRVLRVGGASVSLALHYAAAMGNPPRVDPEAAGFVAARLLASFLLTPGPDLDVDDPTDVRRYAREVLVPLLLGTARS